VAVLAIFIIVIVAAFVAWRAGLFRSKTYEVGINVTTPSR